MIPIGYMHKRIASRPAWIKAASVNDIYSLSGCILENFADYINFWRHNGYWLFDSSEIIAEVAADHSISLEGLSLFYYEAYEKQFDSEDATWKAFFPEKAFETDIKAPKSKTLQGFDITTFFLQTSPECSPLSCNSLSESISTNQHCLLESFDEAFVLLEQGAFIDSGPGPYRIIAVYTVEQENA
jgi:hypothetical protein